MPPGMRTTPESKVRTEIITHDKVDPRMRVRPNPKEVERAAQLLVEAKRPLLIVGDELYRTRSIDKAVQLAEMLGMPVIHGRLVYANFPQTHPLWVGGRALRTQDTDLVINVGNKLQHVGPTPMVPRDVKFIDMRLDSANMGNIITTDVPLVADVGYGLQDLLAALEGIMTPGIKKKVQERSEKIRAFSERAKKLQPVMTRNPDWDQSPMVTDRVTYEIAEFADEDALIVSEASVGGMHTFGFNPLGGREHFSRYAGHLGGATGKVAGVKLARPKRQVICLAGDGAFVFGSVVAWIGAEMEFALSQAVASGDALEHRPPECGHCVQNFLADLDLRDLPGEAARFELGADHALPTTDLRFYPAALVVPCGHLPGHAAVAADLGNMAIPNGWIPRRLRSDHCVLRRRYNHIQGLPIPLPQHIPYRRSIIGAVSQKARNRSIELIQEPG